MTPADLAHDLVPTLPWLLLATGLGVVVALVAGAMLVTGARLPAAVAGLAVAIPTGAILLEAWPPGVVPSDPAVARAVVAASVGHRLLAPIWVGAPALLLALMGAAGGALKPPRRAGPAVLAVALGAVVVAITVAAGNAIDDTTFAAARAVAYGVVALVVAIAMVAGDPKAGEGAGGAGEAAGPHGEARESAALESAASAGVCLPFVVAAGEASWRAMAELMALNGLPGVDPAQRADVVAAYFAKVSTPVEPYAWAAFAVACAVAVLGVALSFRDRRRLAFAATALLWLPLAALLLAAGRPSIAQLLASVAS